MKHTQLSSILLTALFAFANAAHAQQTCKGYIPDNTPNTRYEVNAVDATVFDKQTGLTWQQCSLGQTAAGGTCSGAASAVNWQGALQAAESSPGWRLPNKKELQSLVAFHCYNPSINTSIFPSTQNSVYWSSSPSANDSSGAWHVNFSYGGGYSDTHRSLNYYVRLVR